MAEQLYRTFVLDAQSRVDAAVPAVQRILDSLSPSLPRLHGAEVVGRWKTRKTLIEKLQRSPAEQLPSVRDVAGLRIVADMSLLEQEVLRKTLAVTLEKRFSHARAALHVDRISQPMYGYRASQLIVWPTPSRPIEIQIRTRLLHAWAQLMEVRCDRWGREPRYGLPVRHPDEGERARRQDEIDLLLQASSAVAAVEEADVNSGLLYINLPDEAFVSVERADLDLLELRRDAEERELELRPTKASLAELLTTLGDDSRLHDGRAGQ